MAKIKVIPDEAIEALLPEKTLIRVVAMNLDGTRHTVEVVNPLGHPDNPMQDRHIEEKFMALAEPVLGQERCRTTLDRWWQVRDSGDISQLIQMLDLNTTNR
jgi:2-methylcitrate dehydratase PrpD